MPLDIPQPRIREMVDLGWPSTLIDMHVRMLDILADIVRQQGVYFDNGDRALQTSAVGQIEESDVTSTELGYLDGVTSGIQVQINNKVDTTTITSLTDNTGGTANDTIAAIPDPADTPATADALRDDLVTNTLPEIRNAVADLAAKVNAIITALA